MGLPVGSSPRAPVALTGSLGVSQGSDKRFMCVGLSVYVQLQRHLWDDRRNARQS